MAMSCRVISHGRRWITHPLSAMRKQRSGQVRVILDNLPNVEEALADGSIVVIEEMRVRVRLLPISLE